MNIGIDARMYGPQVGGGGLGRYVEQLVTELQAIDHKNRYVLFLKKENFDACVIINPNFKKRLTDVHWYGLEEQLRMGRMIDREHLDLVHFPHWNVPLLIRTPFVVTIHDLILLDEPFSSKISTRQPWFFWIKYEGYRFVLSRAIGCAQKVITVSHTTSDSIRKHFPQVHAKKIEVVYEGITPLPSLSGLKAGPGLQAWHHSPLTTSPSLLYVGNAYPHKNLERLLEAFRLLHETHPNVTLTLAGCESIFYDRLLAGSGLSSEASAKGENPAYNGINFVQNPTDEQLSELYQNATVFVFPSRMEGFGLPPLEAMSCGVPVAASDIPVLREILGDAAAFFNPSDAQNIASVINDLIDSNEKRASLIQKGTQQTKRYSWHKMATAIQTIYETCDKTET